MLTPMDIHNKEFKMGFRGYSREDVDEYLDLIVGDFEKLYRENTQLKKDVDLNNRQLEQYRKLEQNLQDTLVVAQRTAAQVTDSAKSNAEATKEHARQVADNINREAEYNSKKKIDDAKEEAKRIVAAAEAESKRIIDDANKRIQKIEADYENLVSSRRSFLTQMRNMVQTELDVLKNAEDLVLKAKIKAIQFNKEEEKKVEDKVADKVEDKSE